MMEAGPNCCAPCLAAMQYKAIAGLQSTSASDQLMTADDAAKGMEAKIGSMR